MKYIPTLYDKSGKNKLGELTEILAGNHYVVEERNGLFELSFDYPNGYILSDLLINENMIEVKPNDTQDLQKFRIYDTKCLMKDIITIFARHESFDLANDHVENINLENASCEYALNTLFRNSHFSKHYRGYSDIINAQNYSIDNVNILNAIAGKEGSIIDIYGTGAEILRDGTNIHVLNKRGHDNEVIIEFGKNLTDFVLERDLTDLETRVGGFAKYTDENNQEVIVKSNWIDSAYIDNFAHPYISVEGRRDYSDKFKEGEIPTVEKLDKLCADEFKINKRDIPKSNYTIKFIPLSKCVGYEGVQDKISICDTVRIIDKRFNVDTKAKVIKYKYDFIKGRYDSMELGEPRTTLGDIIGSGNESQVGPQGPQGVPGPPGADGNIGDFPNSLPPTPVLSSKVYGFSSIELSWTYEDKVYYTYELYASKAKDFTPNTFDLIHSGQSSSFLFQAKPNETWYFRVCAKNTHGERTSFSPQVVANTVREDSLSNYFTDMAIGKAVVGSLTADYMEAGIIKGNWIDMRHLTLTDGNGKRVIDIDDFGRAYMDIHELKINSSSVATNKYVSDKVNEGISQSKTYTNSQIKTVNDSISTKVSKDTYDEDQNLIERKFSSLEQGVDEFNYKFQNVGAINEVDDSNFGRGTQRWELVRTDVDVPAKIEYSLNYGGRDIMCTNAAYIGDCSFDKSATWEQRIYPKNNRMTQFTLSGCYHYTNVRHGGGVSAPMANLYMEIHNKDGTVEYYNHANFLNDGVVNVAWETVHQTYTRNNNKAIDYIKLIIYKRNTVGELRITQIDLHENGLHRKWIPGANEINNHITTVDANGVKVDSAHTSQFARIDEEFFCVYNGGEAPINRQVFLGLENDVPTLLLGAHGINPGVSVFGGTHLGFKHYAPDKSPMGWGGSWGMLEYKLDSGTNHISRLGFSQAGNIELIPHSATHLYKNVHVHGNPNAGQAWEISASMGFFPTYIKNWSINAPLRGIKIHSHVIGSDNDNNIYCVSKSGEFSRLHAQIVNMQSARAAYSANISLARVFRDEAQVPVNLGESVEGLALAQRITLERQEEQEEAIICNLLASVEMYEMILETNPDIVNNEKRKSRIAAIYALLIKKDKLNNEDVPKCIIECVRKKLKESF